MWFGFFLILLEKNNNKRVDFKQVWIVQLFFCLFILLSICISWRFFPSSYDLFIYSFNFLFLCLPIYLFIYLFIYLHIQSCSSFLFLWSLHQLVSNTIVITLTGAGLAQFTYLLLILTSYLLLTYTYLSPPYRLGNWRTKANILQHLNFASNTFKRFYLKLLRV